MMLLGRGASYVKAMGISLLLSLAVGMTEELLFRGDLLSSLSNHMGQIHAFLHPALRLVLPT
ncbi:hypothetical protein EON65_20615 [archaeon]|nr:MAG: hypothetical protein EON65_20615 [archaeon]